jgi:hypothetical protein
MAKLRLNKLVGGLVFVAFVSLPLAWLISNVMLMAAGFLALVLAGFFLTLQLRRRYYSTDFRNVNNLPALLTRKQEPSENIVLKKWKEQAQSDLTAPTEPPCRAVREAEEIARAAYNRLYGKP